MRKFCFAAFAAVLIGTTACTPKAPEQFTGKIVDGTMNTVTVESPADGRRVTFTTEDADMQEAYGLLLGNTATVTYRGKLGETTPALKVVTDPAYVTAIGRWVEPNPIDPEQEQGIEIRINGVAASINMLTLRYEAWELAPEGDRIILSGVSEGSGGRILRADGRNYRDGRQAGPQNRCGRSDQKRSDLNWMPFHIRLGSIKNSRLKSVSFLSGAGNRDSETKDGTSSGRSDGNRQKWSQRESTKR